MRRQFTLAELRARGVSESALRWGLRGGRWTRVGRGIYVEGIGIGTKLERALACAAACGGVSSGRVAAVLLGLDGVTVNGPDFTVDPGASGRRPGARRRRLLDSRVVAVDGIPCTDGLQTLLDLAADLNDVEWEQALESGLRKGLTTIDALECGRRELSASRTPGAARVRRVLGQRPTGAPPTESLLETLMVQLIRTVGDLPEPVRQVEVHDEHGVFVARVDLCFPEIGVFLELDGQHHKGQPVYDSTRETAVVATTGWLPGRFTWREVVHLRRTTARRLTGIVGQARRLSGSV